MTSEERFVLDSYAAAGPLRLTEIVERAEYGGADIRLSALRELVWRRLDEGAWHVLPDRKIVPCAKDGAA